MKKSLFIAIFCIIAFGLYSCEDTTGPDSKATVTLKSDMTNSTAKIIQSKIEQLSKDDVDSIQVKKVRILISEVKFHNANENDASKDELYKAGPLLFVVDSTGSKFEIASGTMPAVSYNKLKFEIHRFESSVLSQYSNSNLFKDFATPERYSVIINGIAYKDGIATRFEYKGTPNVNLTVNFGVSINFPAGEETTFYLMLDADDIFKSNDEIYNPLDDSDANKIDDLIKKALKVAE